MIMTLLFAIAPYVASFAVGGAPYLSLPSAARCPSGVQMKGKGTRGMPGKGATATGSGAGGFRKGSKKKFQQKEFERSEWTLVAEKGDLGEEVGSTASVEAGKSPMGQNYIWTLLRGETRDDDEGEETNVYATDGACVACQFPMSKAVITKEDGLELLDCKTCGSQWNLDDGKVFKWFQGSGFNPTQMAMKAINKDKEPVNVNLLQTRVSRAGRVYVRLPDGTLSITETAADRAAGLSGQSPLEAVKAAQKKAQSLD